MPEDLRLIHGDDPYLVEQEAGRWRDQQADAGSDLGPEEFRGSRDWDSLSQSLATPAFLTDRRAVLIWDPPQVLRGQTAAADGDLERFVQLLDTREPTTAVAIALRQTLVAGSKALKRLLAVGAQVTLLQRPKGAELRRYLQRELQRSGLRLGAPSTERLLAIAGHSLGQLASEIQKLQMYAGNQGKVGDAEAARLIAPGPTPEIYRLTDAIFGSPARAPGVLQQLRGSPESSPQMVIGALARVLRDLLSLAAGAQLGLPDWRRERLGRQLDRAGHDRVFRWLVGLADLDWAIRVGAVGAEEGLEAMVARMCLEISRS